MFKLVGDQEFNIGSTPCVIRIEPVSGFAYQYSLLVNGKPLSEFTKQRSTSVCTWVVEPEHRVVLEKETLDIWVDGEKVEATGEFTEDGTETHFTIGDNPAYIRVSSSCDRKTGLVYDLIYKDLLVDQEKEVYD